jgi:uncharacterized membrane protein
MTAPQSSEPDRLLTALRNVETLRRVGRVAEARGTLIRATGVNARIGEVCELRDPGSRQLLTAEVVGQRHVGGGSDRSSGAACELYGQRKSAHNVAMRARKNRRVTRRPLATAVAASPAARSTWDMLIWNHIKLWVAVLVGVVIAVALPARWSVISRVLTGWNCALLVLVPLMYLRLRHLDARQLRAHYEEEDPTAPVIVIVVVAAALLSLLAIVGLLSTLKQVLPAARFVHLMLATLTIVTSWCLVHMMFTVRYADMYYSVAPDKPPPLAFPETREPLFWDFLYFSFTIGVACQTSDVATTQTGIRKTVTVHSIIAFVFNLSILGFAINVSAGLLGQG